jgi:hypothetical protein
MAEYSLRDKKNLLYDNTDTAKAAFAHEGAVEQRSGHLGSFRPVVNTEAQRCRSVLPTP